MLPVIYDTMRKAFLPVLAVMILVMTACNSGKEQNWPTGQLPFEPVPASGDHPGLVIPADLKYQILYQQGDTAITPDGVKGPAKGRHDFMAFIPLERATKGVLWINHEDVKAHDQFGDGGGGTLLDLEMVEGKWVIQGLPRAADFRSVGGTVKNCLGAVTPWRTIITSEEWEPENNVELYDSGRGIRDTTELNGYPRYLNYGWMVEVDPISGRAIRKLWSMGRFMHEAAYCLEDRKTVYLMDDQSPGVFFKFVAENSGDYSKGTLFAYRQFPDGKSGDWVALPHDRDSLNFVREMALKRGATVFIRLEDIEPLNDGTFLITETGRDTTDLSQALALGGRMANHLSSVDHNGNEYHDYVGRILRYDPETNAISVFLEGGQAASRPDVNLANPDNIAIDKRRRLLYIHEDNNGTDQGRTFGGGDQLLNEIYVLDLNIENPRLDDLERFAIGAPGCETTGPDFTPDYNSYFFNLQHPSGDNPEPFNRATTVVVTGFKGPVPQ